MCTDAWSQARTEIYTRQMWGRGLGALNRGLEVSFWQLAPPRWPVIIQSSDISFKKLRSSIINIRTCTKMRVSSHTCSPLQSSDVAAPKKRAWGGMPKLPSVCIFQRNRHTWFSLGMKIWKGTRKLLRAPLKVFQKSRSCSTNYSTCQYFQKAMQLREYSNATHTCWQTDISDAQQSVQIQWQNYRCIREQYWTLYYKAEQ